MASKKTQERLAKMAKAEKVVESKPEEKKVEVQADPKPVDEKKQPAKKEDAKRISKEKLAEIRQELLAQARKTGLEIGETGGVFKVMGKGKLWLSVAKGGATINLLGFCVDGATPVSEEQAKAKHIGKTRGQIDMSEEKGKVVAAFAKALAALQVASVLALFIR